MALAPIDDPREYLGQKLDFTVPPTKGGKSIVVTRRGILERDARKHARDKLKELTPGQRVEGRVTEVRDYGLLVDIGDGVEGLVHQSEVAWGRGVRPADVAKPGDVVQVEVIKVQPATRKERYGKLSLSLRACLPDPWDSHPEALQRGAVHKAKVVRTTEFGAFLEVAPGIEGLLHISELGGRDLKHANQAVKEGEELDVIVERVDKKQRRLSLGKLSEQEREAIESGDYDPTQAPRNLKPGSHVKVVVERVEHHGVIVQAVGILGKRGRGYIPNRELGNLAGSERGRQPLGQGSELEVKITGTDRDGGLRCSVKAKQVDDERRAVKEYRKEAARQGFGTFGDLLKAKLGGNLDQGG